VNTIHAYVHPNCLNTAGCNQLLLLAAARRVWRSSLGNLVTGHDARKPFVDAFADEQLLGFTKVRLSCPQGCLAGVQG
jgi:hypothetical protein